MRHGLKPLVIAAAIALPLRAWGQEYPTTGAPQFGPPTQQSMQPPMGPPPIIGNNLPPGQLFEPGEILATVGGQFILAGDVLPHVNQILEQYKGKAPPEAIEQQRRGLVAQITRSHIESKLLYLQFIRKIPADKVDGIRKNVFKKFDDDLEKSRTNVEKMTKDEYPKLIQKDPQIGRLVLLMKDKGVWSPSELDALLRGYGGSIQQERDYYCEYNLGRAVLGQKINFSPEVSHDEMLAYYEKHAEKYKVPERVKFEIMSTLTQRFPSKDEAFKTICAMGNEVYYGANFAAVAKKASQGLNASEGGLHDWTPRGTLASKRLDEAIFTVEPGKLSQVIEDERGFHILRVIDRQAAGSIPFSTVQIDIREAIRKEKISKNYEEYVNELRGATQITTVFDDDPRLRQAARGADMKKR